MWMKPWTVAGILLLPCKAFGQQPPQQQDPCVIKSEYEALLKQAVAATGPKPAQPKDAKGKALTRAEVERELKTAADIRDKAEIELKVDEKRLAGFQAQLTELENRMRPRLSELNREIQDLTAQIAKTRDVNTLKGLEDRREAKNNEIRRINTDIRELVQDRNVARESIEGKEGVFDGTEKLAVAAEQKMTDLEKQLARIGQYEKWTEADKARPTLAGKKTAYDQAVAAKDQTLAEAKQVVFDMRGKLAAERALLRANERPKFLKSASHLADRAQLEARIKGMDASQKAPLIRAYKENQAAKLNAIVAAMIQQSKDSKNLRLTQVMTNLSQYDCWTDAANYKNTIMDAMKNASVVAGSDFNFTDTEGWEEIPFDDVVDDADKAWVGSWKCSCGITIQLNADKTGSWIDSRGGPPGSMSESGTFTGTWSGGLGGVTLTTSVEKYGRRGGSVGFTLHEGKLRDPWGNLYSR